MFASTCGMGLVVNRVESTYDVMGFDVVQRGHILRDECRVCQSPLRRLGPGHGAALVGEVDAGEPTGGELLCHHVDGMAAATANVGYFGAGAKQLRGGPRPSEG